MKDIDANVKLEIS